MYKVHRFSLVVCFRYSVRIFFIFFSFIFRSSFIWRMYCVCVLLRILPLFIQFSSFTLAPRFLGIRIRGIYLPILAGKCATEKKKAKIENAHSFQSFDRSFFYVCIFSIMSALSRLHAQTQFQRKWTRQCAKCTPKWHLSAKKTQVLVSVYEHTTLCLSCEVSNSRLSRNMYDLVV